MGIFSFFNRKKYVETQPKLNSRLSYFSGGTYVNDDSAMQVSAFYSGVVYISTQVAKLPWRVKDKDNEVQMNNTVDKLLRLSPNGETNSMMFRIFLIQQALIYGNGYAEIERDLAGRVVALWPIPSSHVQPMRRGDTNELVYRIVGGGLTSRDPDAYLQKRDIYKVSNFHTKDGIHGLGILEYAAETLGTAKGADKFANSLFSNGGMPSGTLSTESTLSPDAMERLKESWDSAHSGRKVGGTAILEQGLKYSAISHDPQVLQFLESREFSVLEIARFLRIPPTKLFDIKAATFNNVENSNLEVATDTLDAWARALEIEADVKLLSNSFNGLKSEIDLQAVFRGDMETRSQYFTRLMQAGAITPNQIRVSEGKAPYEGGDRYFIATNNYTPVDKLDEVIESQTKEPAPDPREEELNGAVLNYLKRSQN
jgi:HK97 family phage portal protein